MRFNEYSSGSTTTGEVADEIRSAIFSLVGDFRLELSICAVLLGAFYVATHAFGSLVGSIIVSLAVAYLIWLRPTRHLIMRRLRSAYFRRQFVVGLRHSDFHHRHLVLPEILALRLTKSGYRLRVRMPRGTTVDELAESSAVLASNLCVAAVRVEQDRWDASMADVAVVRGNPFSGDTLPWPDIATEKLDLWQPIPVGLDEDGEEVTISLPERNVLIGGLPGSGKSAAMAMFVAAAAADPTAVLYLLDGKRVDLPMWKRCAEGYAADDIHMAMQLLLDVRAEMERRYARLETDGRWKVTAESGLGLVLIVIDELRFFTKNLKSGASTDFISLLEDIVARGRAAGIVVVAATQRPSVDVVPARLRDLFAYRWAMACSTRDSSDTILGAGWAAEGYDASEIGHGPSDAGIGYLLADGRNPTKIRSYFINQDAAHELADRAAWLRAR